MSIDLTTRKVDKFAQCGICGDDLGPDRLHVVIDNGRVTRHTYACRRHRYVVVQIGSHEMVQERTDHELEGLAFQFRLGKLQEGWE